MEIRNNFFLSQHPGILQGFVALIKATVARAEKEMNFLLKK